MHHTGKRKMILGACLGNCVHVAGILNFLHLARSFGYKTHFLGPAVPMTKIVEAVTSFKPEILVLSYRLTPEAAKNLLEEFRNEVKKQRWSSITFAFGGPPPVAEVARKTGIFEAVFDGNDPPEKVVSFLRGKIEERKKEAMPPQGLLERIEFKAPFPLLRHHFGLPSLEETVKGVREIALSGLIDVISIGPDQNAQESFFRPQEMKKEEAGAGGVPLRKPDHLAAIYRSARVGNYPLFRCYSGTRDLIKWAEMSLQTINIAWGAVPLCWYNKLDGRSERAPSESIAENQEAMRWYGKKKIPLEVNEAHHWSLRDAPDTVAVAAAYLAAYNAKKMGVSHYVAQYMFNTPFQTSPLMDLAKMLAKIELIESLHDASFKSVRQTRTGLTSLSPDFDTAKGQLASSTFSQLFLRPKIIHVVAFCEGDHAATPKDIIQSTKIVQGVINNFFLGVPRITGDARIEERKNQLIEEARLLLEAIKEVDTGEMDDPWINPRTIARAIEVGLLDAPHLKGCEYASGEVETRMIEGACYAVDPETGKPLKEKERITRVLEKLK